MLENELINCPIDLRGVIEKKYDRELEDGKKKPALKQLGAWF